MQVYITLSSRLPKISGRRVFLVSRRSNGPCRRGAVLRGAYGTSLHFYHGISDEKSRHITDQSPIYVSACCRKEEKIIWYINFVDLVYVFYISFFKVLEMADSRIDIQSHKFSKFPLKITLLYHRHPQSIEK